jgi:hypothetical protein
MKAWPISFRVNSPKNNDAETIAPIELERQKAFLGSAFPHEAKIGGIRLSMKEGTSKYGQPIFLRSIELQAKNRD